VATFGPALRADDWPEWRGKGRLGVWNETGIVETIFPPPGCRSTGARRFTPATRGRRSLADECS
jgi:hypothetical protein